MTPSYELVHPYVTLCVLLYSSTYFNLSLAHRLLKFCFVTMTAENKNKSFKVNET